MILDYVKESLSLSLGEGGGRGNNPRKVGSVCRACQTSHTYQILGYSHLTMGKLQSLFNAKKPKQIK